MDKAGDVEPGGSKTAPAPKAFTPAPAPKAVAPAPKLEEVEKESDQFGYEKGPIKEAAPAPKSEAVEEPEEIKPVSGYGKEAQGEEEEETPPVVPPKEEEKVVDLGFELKVDEKLPKNEVASVKEFAKKHGLTKEAAQEYLDLRVTEMKEQETAQAQSKVDYQKAVKAQRKAWETELKTDPEFGGEKYGHNIKQAEKVLEEFMPGTKKILTEKGTMLPPYVMRDLANIANHVYKTEGFVNGNPSVSEDESDTEMDPLDFYNQK